MAKARFFHNTLAAVSGTLKLLLKFKNSVILPFDSGKGKLCILGNGPSLKHQMDDLLFLETIDFMAVNYFACTDPFESFKPTHYVIASPQYWIKDKQQEWNTTRNQVFECMKEKVTWEMHLYVPVIAKSDKKWQKSISENSNIKINYINLSPIDDNPRFFTWFMKKHLVCPRPHNVLVPSLLCGINRKYSNIYLAGADHSWIPEISVTPQNDVLIAQKHFYGEDNKKNSLLSDKAKPMYSPGSQDTFKLHEVLQKFYYSFKSYWVLKEYASQSGVEIYNLLESSYIDAFDKIDLHELTSKKTH